MKKNTLIVIFELLLTIFAFLFCIIFRSQYSYSEIIKIILIFFSALVLLAIVILKYPRGKNYLNGYAVRLIVITLMATLLIIYLSGLILGFCRNTFTLTISNIIMYSYPIVVLSILEEILRYIILKRSEKKFNIILLTIIYMVINICVYSINYMFVNDEAIFIFICTIALPIIVKECLYSYMTYKISIIPTLVLRLCLELYSYVFPIYPDLGNYLLSIISIFLPFVIYKLMSNLVDYAEKVKVYVKKVGYRIIYVPIIIFLMVIVGLVSGIFKYKMIAISSGSMEPVFCRGDAVIYEKTDPKDVKVGDVLAFKSDNRVITHRVIYIVNNDNKLLFKTRGDANNTADADYTSSENVYGIVKYVVPKIGYPTIWINDKFGNID